MTCRSAGAGAARTHRFDVITSAIASILTTEQRITPVETTIMMTPLGHEDAAPENKTPAITNA